jgi:lysophospholipase L1-like esterase
MTRYRLLLGALVTFAIAMLPALGALSAQTPVGSVPPQAPPRPVVQIGPPAPVPPEVAMLRDASQIAQINEAVTRLIEADRSPSKSLLVKYASLLTLQVPRLNTAATFTQTVQRMGPRHEGFVETAKQGNIDLLLHGDSITDWWVQNDDNKEMFQKYFGQIRTANFAVSGDTTQGVLWGLKNGEGQGFQPKAVMLMIGTNNTGPNTAPEIAEGIGAVVLELRRDFPDAKILLLAIFPRAVPGDPVRDKIAEINKTISRLNDDQHVFYLDIGAKFLDDKGVFLPGAFRADNLHPMAKGYDIWGEAVQTTLARLLK